MRGLAATPHGAVAVGRFEGTLAAGRAAMTSAGRGDGFALALSPAGQVVWHAALSGAADEDLVAVAARPDGAIAVAGTASGDAALAGRPIAASGQPGAVIARLDAGGAPIWQRAIDVDGYAVPAALAWTDEGDLVVAGYFSGTLDPRGAALHGAGGLDVWAARLAGADGRAIWIHRAGGPGTDAAHAIAVAGGAVLVAGSFQRWADFSSTTLRGADETADPFIAAVGPSGFARAHSFPADGDGAVRAIGLVSGARLALAITFDGFVEVRGARFPAGESTGGLVALVDPSGEAAWARPIAGLRSADALVSRGGDLVVAGASTEGGALAAISLEGGDPRWTRPVAAGLPVALAAGKDGIFLGGSGFVTYVRAPR